MIYLCDICWAWRPLFFVPSEPCSEPLSFYNRHTLEKGTTEGEMAGWHHWLHGHESEWTPGVGDGQGSLACCDSWGRRESDTTERLNWTELNWDSPHTCGLAVHFASEHLVLWKTLRGVQNTFAACAFPTSSRLPWILSPSSVLYPEILYFLLSSLHTFSSSAGNNCLLGVAIHLEMTANHLLLFSSNPLWLLHGQVDSSPPAPPLCS